MTDTPPRPRPLAMSDIAALLDVSTNTVNAWRKRAAGAKQVEPFPPPAGKVATKIDYWWEDEVAAWAQRTGRWKTEQHPCPPQPRGFPVPSRGPRPPHGQP